MPSRSHKLLLLSCTSQPIDELCEPNRSGYVLAQASFQAGLDFCLGDPPFLRGKFPYPLPAFCLLIACSGILVTIRVFNEMQLDYSHLHTGFAHKTTEQS